MKKRSHPAAPGPIHFVTVATHKRIPLFRSQQLCREFFSALTEVKTRFPFELYAYVLLPDHFHLLLRPGDGNISRLLQKIKSLAARRIVKRLKAMGSHKTLTSLKKATPGRRSHQFQVFQQSFRDLLLQSPWMVKQKIDYIHKNPISERLVENVADYPWSSWRAIHERSGEPVLVESLPV
jgi:putative transposase